MSDVYDQKVTLNVSCLKLIEPHKTFMIFVALGTCSIIAFPECEYVPVIMFKTNKLNRT